MPSEPVFSSSKENCTVRRANLLPPVLEALWQMLKFSYKQDRLNFTEDLVADDVDYNISGHAPKKVTDEPHSSR